MSGVLLLGGIGLLTGLLLGLLPDREPGQTEEILAALPGLDCGGCGYPGCRAYAEAVERGASKTLCRPGGAKTVRALEKIKGI